MPNMREVESLSLCVEIYILILLCLKLLFVKTMSLYNFYLACVGTMMRCLWHSDVVQTVRFYL